MKQLNHKAVGPGKATTPRKEFRRRGQFQGRGRDRGSVLVLVMGVSAIVGVIGLSSLLAVRLQHRDVDARGDATQAAILADGALRVMHARLSETGDWRSTHTSGSWSTDETLGLGAAMRYKLTDEADDDLSDSDEDAARLTVRVAYGDAVRLASITIAGGSPLGPELVTNGDMEAGATGYKKSYFGGTVSSDTSNPRGGTTSLLLSGRSSTLDGWQQDFTAGSTPSGTTFRVSAWMRVGGSATSIKLGLVNKFSFVTDVEEGDATATTDWAFYQFDLTPEYSITPADTFVYGRTPSNTQDIYIDDLSVREVLSNNALSLIRGSYRRKLDR